jgi:hypothetical protein
MYVTDKSLKTRARDSEALHALESDHSHSERSTKCKVKEPALSVVEGTLHFSISLRVPHVSLLRRGFTGCLQTNPLKYASQGETDQHIRS